MRKTVDVERWAISNRFCYSFTGFIVLMLFAIPVESLAQRPAYHIVAKLDTASHTLQGSIEITYTNRSNVKLDSLGLHLWPNAYADKNSAFGKQLLNQGDFSFRSAPFTSTGWISGLTFTSSDRSVQLRIDDTQPDIAWLMPSPGLNPGESITLASPFRLQVPESLSRLGVTGDSYQFTQWYPHIAVFDQGGWQVMPYLDQGEFYNDFADYTVEVEVPVGYTVAATGVLESKQDQKSTSKWMFKAENVIDFAWFASPSFKVDTQVIMFQDGKETKLQVYQEPVDSLYWTNASMYAKRAIEFYSDWLGPYPYPRMSVVSAPASSGGYMEYPMVAQISYTRGPTFLDLVIAHEIGHTWLYGILANNERKYPWLDEGLNTFIEDQYRLQYHPEYIETYVPGIMHSGKGMPDLDAHQYNYRFGGKLQPPAASPEQQIDDQYFFSAYRLPAQGLEIMKDKLGTEMMKQMFRQYYADHQFTHVTPEDLRQSFESTCSCDLTWFFEDWIQRAHELDYRLTDFDPKQKEITISNKGNANIPVKLTTFLKDEKLKDHWVNGFENEKTIHLDERCDEVRIYDGMMGINANYTANIKPRTILPRIRFLPQVESYSAPIISVTPLFGYNLADGFMPGIALTSGLFPQNKLKWIAAPMYGLESKKFRGFATLRYTSEINKGPFDRFVLSLGLDDFGYNLDTHYLFRDAYFKWEPTLALRSNPSDKHPRLTSWWKYRFVHIRQDYGRGINFEEGIYAEDQRSYGVHELMYEMRSDDVLRPFEGQANVQAGKGFVRINLLYKQHFVGKNKHRGTWIRGFAGWLPVYDQPDANVAFTFNGIASNGYFSKDYMFDQWLGGRNAESGFFAHQAFERDAHLKTLSTVGIGEDWMIAAGVSQAFPFRFLHFYMDATLFNSAVESKTQFSYSGGAAIVLWKDVFEIYLPLLESKDILQSASYDVRDVWYERVSFKANIKFLNPLNRIDRDQLRY